MDTHIGNTGLLVKIPTHILGYTGNTHMVTHAVILSAAKDLIARNTIDKHRNTSSCITSHSMIIKQG